jgi:hypothetical protein
VLHIKIHDRQLTPTFLFILGEYTNDILNIDVKIFQRSIEIHDCVEVCHLYKKGLEGWTKRILTNYHVFGSIDNHLCQMSYIFVSCIKTSTVKYYNNNNNNNNNIIIILFIHLVVGHESLETTMNNIDHYLASQH